MNPDWLCPVRGSGRGLWNSFPHVSMWEKASGPAWGGEGRGSGQVPDSLNMAFSLRKQLMKLSKSMSMSSFAYLATSTCVTLLFTLMPGRERGAEESPVLCPLPPSSRPQSPLLAPGHLLSQLPSASRRSSRCPSCPRHILGRCPERTPRSGGPCARHGGGNHYFGVVDSQLLPGTLGAPCPGSSPECPRFLSAGDCGVDSRPGRGLGTLPGLSVCLTPTLRQILAC